MQLLNSIFPPRVEPRPHARLNNFPIMADAQSVIRARAAQAHPYFQTLSTGSITRQSDSAPSPLPSTHTDGGHPRLVAQGGIISTELQVGIQRGGKARGGGPRPSEVSEISAAISRPSVRHHNHRPAAGLKPHR